jgi:penicillin V acylase-like amidase (Ntn superfamily)
VEYLSPSDDEMGCTSIVAQDPSGNVFHGRNMDWNLPNNLRNLTVQADFVKNGTVVFTADVTTGYVGIVTGVSKYGFSLSINERERGGEPLVDSLNALLRHAWCPTHLERQVSRFLNLN